MPPFPPYLHFLNFFSLFSVSVRSSLTCKPPHPFFFVSPFIFSLFASLYPRLPFPLVNFLHIPFAAVPFFPSTSISPSSHLSPHLPHLCTLFSYLTHLHVFPSMITAKLFLSGPIAHEGQTGKGAAPPACITDTPSGPFQLDFSLLLSSQWSSGVVRKVVTITEKYESVVVPRLE